MVGGAHGNEANGVALAKHFIEHPELVARPSFETVAMIANPEAVERNTRFVETDLNRCFDVRTQPPPKKLRRRKRKNAAGVLPCLSLIPSRDFLPEENS